MKILFNATLRSFEHTLKELIHSKIDPNPDYEKAGVYIIPFSTEQHESLFYIGMTSRKFKERLKEQFLISSLTNQVQLYKDCIKKKILR